MLIQAGRLISTEPPQDFRNTPSRDALEQAIWEWEDERADTLVHHSDRGVQYLSIRYTERLAEAGIEPSVGSRGDSYDNRRSALANALAESVIGLFKTELIRRRGPWRGLEDVELATLGWVWWFSHHRLLEPIGYVPRSSTRRPSTAASRNSVQRSRRMLREVLLQCCRVEMDRRGGIVDYEPTDRCGGCGSSAAEMPTGA